MTVHAEAFAGRAEQRQQHDCEGVQEKKPVAPLRIGDAKNAQAHSEAKVLAEAKILAEAKVLGVTKTWARCSSAWRRD